MPQMKNAKKALRKSDKRAVRNLDIKMNIRFLTKQTKKQAAAQDAKSDETLKRVIKAIDKATQKGIFKKNTAARKKSRLIKALKKVAAK